VRMEETLQIWRVAANIFNKQSRTAEKGNPPAWWLGVGLTIPHRKKINLLRTFIRILGPGLHLWFQVYILHLEREVPVCFAG
jgi:hypothetical protein